MIINNTKKIYNISAKLASNDIKKIKEYITDAVNAACNRVIDEPISVRNLFGREKSDWNNTPLQQIFNYHLKQGKSYKVAKNRAASDVGCLLKSILNEDARSFEIVGKDTGTLYKLI